MRRPLFMVCLCLVVIAGLAAGSTDRSGLDGKSCVVTGRVYQKDSNSFYLDSITSFYSDFEAADQQQRISFTDNLKCETNGETEVRLGSIVQVSGVFGTYPTATNPGEFDQAQYYYSLQIGGRLRQVTVLEESEDYSELQELLFQIREYFKQRLYNVFPEKEASVMCAMLLGDKTELDGEIKELYQENGIVHILSISGLHITIIGMSIYNLLRRSGVPVWAAAMCGGGILLLYGIMTGMSVSASRAIGMYLLRILAEVVGRTYDMLTALGVMAAILVWSNPGYLVNAGFYLSFGAVLGIGMLYPTLLREKKEPEAKRYEPRRWKRILHRLVETMRCGLEQSMLSGLSVTLMTLPVQLWFYFEIPTYSVLINLMVIPLMSTVMICGLVAMLVPGLGILGTVNCLILGGYEWLCKCFSMLPFHTWNPGKPMLWQVVIYYVLLLGMVGVSEGWKLSKRRKKANIPNKSTHVNDKWFCALRISILTMAVILLTNRFSRETLVTFLDVGQGDCICVQLASGEVYLFDCGSTNRSEVGKYVLKPFLKYYGIGYVDAVFVSHPDEDHCNGITELLSMQEEWGIAVRQLVLPQVLNWETEMTDILACVAVAKENGQKTDVITIKAGDYWEVSGNRFLCLHPPVNCTLQDTNSYSQCFYIKLEDNMTMLLTGDVEGVGEEMLLTELKKRAISDITLLKVAHHGSRYASSRGFLEQITPQIAVISCGAHNSYGHPHKETLERLAVVGCKVLVTAEEGAVTIEAE